ncbi:hypothetical protein [Mycolicibacterium baixiangningiae]|uniref:hypothetical protein n=1 Tax=Mycolicibacterium baixiangningiae TaxID=2761578 RepID=UPI001866794B|nr:hypothetical protein [Mycolicibacterium baixiangningiae]
MRSQKRGLVPRRSLRAPSTIKVWPQAVRSFKFHHGGTDAEAEVQIRWMLEDFLENSGRTVTTANYLVLSREGYRLDIGPNRKAVTAYRSAHRERTWEQVKFGIPSRIDSHRVEPMPLLPTLEAAAPEPVPPKRPTPMTLARIRPVVKRAAPTPSATDEEHAHQQQAVIDATKADTPEPTESRGSVNTRPPVNNTGNAAESASERDEHGKPVHSDPRPAEPFSDQQNVEQATQSDDSVAGANRSTGRQVSLSTAAAMAFCALLIGRQLGRRR